MRPILGVEILDLREETEVSLDACGLELCHQTLWPVMRRVSHRS